MVFLYGCCQEMKIETIQKAREILANAKNPYTEDNCMKCDKMFDSRLMLWIPVKDSTPFHACKQCFDKLMKVE